MQHARALIVTVDDMSGQVGLDGHVIGYNVMSYMDPDQVMEDVSRALAELLNEKLGWPLTDPNEN